MDIQTRFILFCDYALISSDGKLSIIGEFDHLMSTFDRPVLNKGFLVASLIATPKKEFNLALQLVDDSGKNEVFNRPLNVTSGEDGKLNIILGFENLVFNGFGLYKAVILDGKVKVTEAKLHVLEVKQQKPAQA
mgnify:CR=1 FL=1